ncbi:hypothetical protein V8C86DRAFT_2781316 [Haematococcus lacustris]
MRLTVAAVSQPGVRPSRCCRPTPQAPRIVARFGGQGNVLDRPDIQIKQGGWDSDRNITLDPRPRLETGSGGIDRQRSTGRGGGNYRVLLLNSPSHTERAVVKAITSVVPGTDEAHAKNCYATSLSLGMALVVSALKEHAEHYAQQLYSMGCKAAIEPDTSTA